MARYLGPKAKLSRREGTDLFLKSARRSISDKAKFDSMPGQHGRTSGARTSDYGLQLREKQKVRRFYGVQERQFRRYFSEASRRKGMTGEQLLSMLESRLDNVIYRFGFADSRAQARQLVRHGHISLNGRRTNIPSALVSVGDKITVYETSRSKTYFKDRLQVMQSTRVPAWLSLDLAAMGGSVVAAPAREDVEIPLNEQLIVEYYNR